MSEENEAPKCWLCEGTGLDGWSGEECAHCQGSGEHPAYKAMRERVYTLEMALGNLVRTYRGMRPDAPGFPSRFFKAIPLLAQAEKVLDDSVAPYMDSWISVEEQLPTGVVERFSWGEIISEDVLVYDPKLGQVVAKLETKENGDIEWSWPGDDLFKPVEPTHWSPLPPAPKSWE